MQRPPFRDTRDRRDGARGSSDRRDPVVVPVVLAILFFVVLTPVGFLLRLVGRDALRLKRDPMAASYWIPRRLQRQAPNSMHRQF